MPTTPLPLASSFNAPTVTQAQFQNAISTLLDYLQPLLGQTGDPADARVALGLGGVPLVYNSRGAWAASTAYHVNDLVQNSSVTYVCLVAYTSTSSFSADLAAGYWTVYQGVTAAQLGASSGAMLVNSISALSGALARAVGSKLYDIVSILDFGADPTGTTDSTSAFNNAQTQVAINGGTIFVPAGIYLHTGIIQNPNVSMVGVGAGAQAGSNAISTTYSGSVLKNTSSNNSITIAQSSVNMRNSRLSYLKITSTGSAPIGVNASEWGNQAIINECEIDSHTQWGLYAVNCWNLIVHHNWFINNGTSGTTSGGAYLGAATNAAHVYDNMFHYNLGYGIAITGTSGTTVGPSNDFEGNSYNDIWVNSGTAANYTLNIINNYFEQTALSTAATHYDVNSCTGGRFDGNHWSGTNGTATSSTGSTFCRIDSGNVGITGANGIYEPYNTYGGVSIWQYNTYYDILSGAHDCTFTYPFSPWSNISNVRGIAMSNSSNSCRIYFAESYEAGLAVYSSTSQTISGSTPAPVQFTGVEYDNKGEFNPSTYAVVPNDPGEYDFNYSILIGATSGRTYYVQLYDTISETYYSQHVYTAGVTGAVSLQGVFTEGTLNPGNSLVVVISASAGGDTITPGNNETWLRVKRV